TTQLCGISLRLLASFGRTRKWFAVISNEARGLFMLDNRHGFRYNKNDVVYNRISLTKKGCLR
ncbi:MAG: hypothetical protein ABS888_05795, partial [Eubacteriales bacterium]